MQGHRGWCGARAPVSVGRGHARHAPQEGPRHQTPNGTTAGYEPEASGQHLARENGWKAGPPAR
eukprot:1083271-Alexandrium_andersonii.AAC.1